MSFIVFFRTNFRVHTKWRSLTSGNRPTLPQCGRLMRMWSFMDCVLVTLNIDDDDYTTCNIWHFSGNLTSWHCQILNLKYLAPKSLGGSHEPSLEPIPLRDTPSCSIYNIVYIHMNMYELILQPISLQDTPSCSIYIHMNMNMYAQTTAHLSAGYAWYYGLLQHNYIHT